MNSNPSTGAVNVASNAAIEAGKVIAQNITKLDRIRVSEKTGGQHRKELVSEVDLLSERTIIELLKESYPDFSILSEEAGLEQKDSDFTWIIDPLDGTNNFVHGHPHCCISIALRQKSEIIAAVVYDPLRNELFSARKGGGAQLDGRRIRVSETSRLADSLLCTGFPYTGGEQTKRWLRSFATLMPRAQSVHRQGSSVLDLAYVACGRYDGFWEFGLREWDIAAGSLLVREAGGLISDISGDKDFFKTGDLVAGTPKVYEKLQQLVSAV